MADEAIRHGYEAHGVQGFYEQFGAEYRNPHEPKLRALITQVYAAHGASIGSGRALDLACGSGEVTCALTELLGWAIEDIDASDPFTSEAYTARVGVSPEPWRFEDVASGALAGRAYRLILCSFALHLVSASRLPGVCWALAEAGAWLLILTPHKRPDIQPAWGWTLEDERVFERVRARLYRSTHPRWADEPPGAP